MEEIKFNLLDELIKTSSELYDDLHKNTNILNELYNITTKFNFDIINTPTNIYQQREQIFRKYREDIIDFIKFIV